MTLKEAAKTFSEQEATSREKNDARHTIRELTTEIKDKVRQSGLTAEELDKRIADGIRWAKN